MKGRPAIVVFLAALALGRALCAGPEALPLDQSRVRQRMGEVEQRLLEMAGPLEPQQPERAEQLRHAFKLSRDRLIVSRMARIGSLLGQERYAEAAWLQQEVLEDLDRLAGWLNAGQWAGELTRLREALSRLEALARRESDAVRRTRELSRLAAEGPSQAHAAAAENQRMIRSHADDLHVELRGGPGADHLAGSLGLMAQAERALRTGADADALAAQLEAGRHLVAAAAEVQRAISRLEAQRRAETRLRLREILRGMLEGQQAILAETKEVDRLVGHQPRPSRAQLLRIAALARREEGLLDAADEALALLEADGTSVALPAALKAVKADIAACAQLLQEGRTGALVQGLQEHVVAILAALIEALRTPEADRLRKLGERPPTKKGKGGAEALVEVVEELKVMRAMQVSLNRQTARADDLRGQSAELTDEVRAEIRRLAQRQGGIRRTVGDLQRALARWREG